MTAPLTFDDAIAIVRDFLERINWHADGENFVQQTLNELLEKKRSNSLAQVTAALVVLTKFNVPPDTQELLIRGNPTRDIPPGALAAALSAAQGTDR